MKTVIYSKFSAERSRSFAIRTDILCGDDGSRMLLYVFQRGLFTGPSYKLSLTCLYLVCMIRYK